MGDGRGGRKGVEAMAKTEVWSRERQGTEEWAPYTSKHTTETLFLGSAPPLDQVLCTFLCLGK